MSRLERNRRAKRSLAATIALTLLLGACGSPSDDKDAPKAPTAVDLAEKKRRYCQ